MATLLHTSSVNLLQYIDVNQALYIMDLLKFGVKHIVVKLQTLAAVGIRAEMQFLACCVSLGKYFRATHAQLNFVLCTLYNRVIFGARAMQQLPISLVCDLNLLWPFPGL